MPFLFPRMMVSCCCLALLTCMPKSQHKGNNMNADVSTTITINNRFTSVTIPVSSLGNLKGIQFLELTVRDVYNPTLVPIYIGASVGLGDSMVQIEGFSLFPSNNGGNFLIDISPYTDILCSGKTRDIRIGLVEEPLLKDTFSMNIDIRHAKR